MRWHPRSEAIPPIEVDEDFSSAVNSRFQFNDPVLTSVFTRLLSVRGINSTEAAEKFLSPSLAHLHSPFLMKGMNTAVERIEAAIDRKETILIYGDYDVDGTTAIVILKTAIELCGGITEFHVPHRIRDGYDLRGNVIEIAAGAGVRLVVSVDCGIRAFPAAETARRLGVDLIVTDHHIPGPDGIPHALAVLNPNQTGCEYPCKALCGAGVAFKLAQCLMERRFPGKDQSLLMTSFLKIVAIATIADAVPLTGENRVFAKLGLEALRSAINPGLKALLDVAKLGGRPLSCSEVAFRIAPRINAAGRMDIARDVIELFSVKDPTRAREIAHKLDQLNSERQEEERNIMKAIQSRIEQDPSLADAFCMVIDGESWHRGVIGITATRVVERYGRPTLVISRDGEEAHGSGRSIPVFHLLNALETCSDLFTRYGGHAHAVGFSLPTDRIAELRAKLDAVARTHLTESDFEPAMHVDADIALEHISPVLFRALHELEPHGVGNPEPVFSARGVRLMVPPQIMKDKHVRLKLGACLDSSERNSDFNDVALSVMPRCDPDSSGVPKRKQDWRKAITHRAIGWRMAESIQQARLLPGDALDIAFTIGRNEHPDFDGVELSLKDFRVSATCTRTAASGCPSQGKPGSLC